MHYESLLFCFCRELTDISILNSFIHLRYVDLSKNKLKTITALNSLQHLLTLKCEHNKLETAQLEELPYIQMINLANNRIKATDGLNHPLVEHINLNCKSTCSQCGKKNLFIEEKWNCLNCLFFILEIQLNFKIKSTE